MIPYAVKLAVTGATTLLMTAFVGGVGVVSLAQVPHDLATVASGIAMGATTPPGIMSLIENASTAAIACVLLWWMMTRFERLIGRLQRSIGILIHLEHTSQGLLLRHDAKVHGINPSIGADHDERMRQAIDSFKSAEMAWKDQGKLIDTEREK